jgi:hypothetical protein
VFSWPMSKGFRRLVSEPAVVSIFSCLLSPVGMETWFAWHTWSGTCQGQLGFCVGQSLVFLHKLPAEFNSRKKRKLLLYLYSCFRWLHCTSGATGGRVRFELRMWWFRAPAAAACCSKEFALTLFCIFLLSCVVETFFFFFFGCRQKQILIRSARFAQDLSLCSGGGLGVTLGTRSQRYARHAANWRMCVRSAYLTLSMVFLSK